MYLGYVSGMFAADQPDVGLLGHFVCERLFLRCSPVKFVGRLVCLSGGLALPFQKTFPAFPEDLALPLR